MPHRLRWGLFTPRSDFLLSRRNSSCSSRTVRSDRRSARPGGRGHRASAGYCDGSLDWAVVHLDERRGRRLYDHQPQAGGLLDNQGAVFNLQTQQLDFLGQNGFPDTARRLHKGDFGPRLGIAYRVGERTVLRAGYGLTWIEMAGITTPFTVPQFPFIQTVT